MAFALRPSPIQNGNNRNNNNSNNNNTAKYRQLANSNVFVPVAIETAGTWNHLAMELTQELVVESQPSLMIQGRQASCSSGCQWLCNGGMRSPSAALSSPNKRRCDHFAYTTISSAYWLVLVGKKIIIITIIHRFITHSLQKAES